MTFTSCTSDAFGGNGIIVRTKEAVAYRYIAGIARIYPVIISHSRTGQTDMVNQYTVAILRNNSPIIRAFQNNIFHHQVIAMFGINHIICWTGIVFPIGTV